MKIIRNAVPDNIIDLCNEDIDSKIYEKVWVTNTGWAPELYDGIAGSCIAATLNSSCLISIRTKLRDHFPVCKKIHYHYYLWKKHSGINWHDDGNWKFGATLYLNDWKKEWGGLFLWEDNGLHVMCPQKGMLVVNTEIKYHCVTPVSTSAPYDRRSIQIFGIDKE